MTLLRLFENAANTIKNVMKSIKIIICLFIICFSVVAQTEKQTIIDKKNTIGIHIAPSFLIQYNGLIPFGGHLFYSYFGIEFSRKLKGQWSLCSGVERLAFINKHSIPKRRYLPSEVPEYRTNYFFWLCTSIPILLKHDFENGV